MIKKDLLIVYNTFGLNKTDESQYIDDLKRIFWHIKLNMLQNNVRVVVSSVLNQDKHLDDIKKTFGDSITIFKYDYRWPVQVSFNKTVLSAIDYFKEDYEGYFYISAGIKITYINDLFKRIINKNNSGEYGIMHMRIQHDNGHENLNDDSNFQTKIFHNDPVDYEIPVKHFCHFHAVVINKSIKEFYGVPITDVFGKCGMEIPLSYISYALKKKYTLLGNSFCEHNYHTDSDEPSIDSNGNTLPFINCGLLWGRKHQDFIDDIEAIDAGLGYWPGHFIPENNPWIYYCSLPNLSKYDENYFALDERLKDAVKRRFFANKDELDYNIIEYTIYG